MKRFDIVRSLMMLVVVGASTSVFAVGNPQVYDVRFVLRTTVAQRDTLNWMDNPFMWEDDEEVVYREPRTVSWHGLIWGVGSNAINGLWEQVWDAQEQERIGGCVMWDAATKQVTYLANGSDLSDVDSVPGCNFGWDFFNAIGQNGRLCEGCWTMEQYGSVCEGTEWEEQGFELFRFVGSGFGTLTFSAQREEGYIDITDASHVDSIAGDLTGYMKAPTMIIGDGCSLCGNEAFCEFAMAWSYCDCDDYLCEEYTAAHGTWVVKYNPLYAKRYAEVTSIVDSGCFDDLPNVLMMVRKVESYFWDYDPMCGDELDALMQTKAAVKAAEANLKEALVVRVAAEADCANVTDEALQQALEKAQDANNAAQSAYDAANARVQASQNAYDQQMLVVTNGAWTVTYKNASGNLVQVSGTGVAAFSGCLDDLKYFTLVTISYGEYNFATREDAMKYAAVQTELVAKRRDVLQSDRANLAAAEVSYLVAQNDAVEAQARYNNRLILQVLAQKNVEAAGQGIKDAEAVLAKAQAAFDEAEQAYDDCCND